MTLSLPTMRFKIPMMLMIFGTSLVMAEEKERSKDGSASKQVHFPVTVGDLIANLKKDEEALTRIKSLYVKWRATVHRTDAEIEKNRQELQSQFSGRELSPETFSSLRACL